MVKYKSKRFSEIDPSILEIELGALTVKINVITGWQIPDDDTYLNVFRQQLVKLVSESYKDMNPDEFEYAMRNYGTKIKDWGKAINLSLIREALDRYLTDRAGISEYEERTNNADIKALPPGECDWSDEWERLQQRAQEGKELIISTALYDWMDRSGKIFLTTEQKHEFMNKALEELISHNETEKLQGFDRGVINELRRLKDGSWKSDPRIYSKIVNRAKILSIKDLLI